MLKDILAIIDTGALDDQFIKTAQDFARFHQAHLSIAIVAAIPTPDYALAAGPPYIVLSDYLEATEQKKAAICAMAQKEGLEVRILDQVAATLTEQVPVQARYSDLILFGTSSVYENSKLRRHILENIAFSSGRPVMILPADWKPRPFSHLAIGWNATRDATRALVDGLRLAEAGAAIEVLIVGGKPSRASHGSEPGADIARNIARHGFKVAVHRIEAAGRETSSALLDFAQEHRVELLILGAAAHSRLRELFLGGVTHDLIDGGAVPILFGH